METQRFRSSMDAVALWITIGVSVIATASLIVLFERMQWHGGSSAKLSMTTLTLFAIYLFAYAFSSSEYLIRDCELVIWRPAGSVRIPLSEIVAHRLLMPEETKGMIRVFGVGGLFGWYGRFWNSQLGQVTMYARNRRNMLLIQTTTRGAIILSPDDPSMAHYL